MSEYKGTQAGSKEPAEIVADGCADFVLVDDDAVCGVADCDGGSRWTAVRPSTISSLRLLRRFGGADAGEEFGGRFVARVLRDEWHLDFCNMFEHIAFVLVPWFGEMWVGFLFSFSSTRLESAGAVGDSVEGNRVQYLFIESLPE